MLGLPKSTEVRRALPKAQLFKQFDCKPAWRTAFDADIARLDFVNWISPQTVPAIAPGADVKEIYVIEVQLKSKISELKSIERLAKAITQHIVWLLTYGEEHCLAVYHERLFVSEWFKDLDSEYLKSKILELSTNLDAVWQNIVSAIGDFAVAHDITLSEQIKTDEERAKIERQIATLKRQMAATNQPRRKREFFCLIQELKEQL